VKVGLTLPNAGVNFGATTPEQLLEMARIADQSDLFEFVWVGDSLLAKPRMESMVLLSALAGQTRRVRLGVACMASFTIRDPILLAYQWASLDLLARGRTVLVACTGINPQGQVESEMYGVRPRDRVKRLIEWIQVLKALWTQDQATFAGEIYRFSDITIAPKPAAKPHPPIWIANDPRSTRERAERTHKRVATYADGWQTGMSALEHLDWHIDSIREHLAQLGRDPSRFDFSNYHNFNINPDRDAALAESKRFLDTYYSTDFPPDFVAAWTATGSPEQCIEHILEYQRLGFTDITLRATSWDQVGQLQRLMEDVLPFVSPVAA
jgi:alkanesulfonate monooxygenase SsuD/methylene tetrahydromethanopterin reductase-like flavin-dependent oxidoreductase (luciferase family)